MSDSANEPRGGFLGIRVWVWSVLILTAVLVGSLIYSAIPTGGNQEKPVSSEAPTVEMSVAKAPPASNPDPEFDQDPAPPEFEAKTNPSKGPEFVEAVFQSDLNVILVSRPGLGQISVEKYDSAGNPTGQPLKSGTQVQIPDPDWPGEKIYFKVP
jgi:hypothetical protein